MNRPNGNAHIQMAKFSHLIRRACTTLQEQHAHHEQLGREWRDLAAGLARQESKR